MGKFVTTKVSNPRTQDAAVFKKKKNLYRRKEKLVKQPQEESKAIPHLILTL